LVSSDQVGKRRTGDQGVLPETLGEEVDAGHVAYCLGQAKQRGDDGQREVEHAREKQAAPGHGESWRSPLVRSLALLTGRCLDRHVAAGPDQFAQRLGVVKPDGGKCSIVLLVSCRPARLELYSRQAKQARGRPLANVDILYAIERNGAMSSADDATVDADLVGTDPIFKSPPVQDHTGDEHQCNPGGDEQGHTPASGRGEIADHGIATNQLPHAPSETGDEEKRVKPLGLSDACLGVAHAASE